MSTIVSYLK